MTTSSRARVMSFLDAEYSAAHRATLAGDTKEAWRHLERAHIVAQGMFAPHLLSHWCMLCLAFKTADPREILGQLLRLALAPLGHLMGRLPLGNTGRSNVSAFEQMNLPEDLKAILEPSST